MTLNAAAAVGSTSTNKWKMLSRRIDATDTPVIDFTRRLMAKRKDALSLAQGIVHWGPPPAALERFAARMVSEPAAVSGYAPNEGLPALRAALRRKLATKNNLPHYDVIVTPGCNQAFLNVMLALCDIEDRVVLFRPYYFDHLMAMQMTGSADRVVYGMCDEASMRPSLEWLRGELAGPQPPKMVVIVNPCNPTGVLLSRAELDAFASLCASAGCWLVLDNTYEDFVFTPGGEHYCPAGPHIIHLFSMSKAYGMMGWRIGYIAFPDYAQHNTDVEGEAAAPEGPNGTAAAPNGVSSAPSPAVAAAAGGPATVTAPGALGLAQLKVQDAVCICAPQPSQQLALEALTEDGREYVEAHIRQLEANRALLRSALAPLEPHVVGGEGAIYLWARLPPACGQVQVQGGDHGQGEVRVDDRAVVEWLVEEAGVCVIPGSACGKPGYIRCSYANLPPEKFPEAVARLRVGLEHLAAHGMTPLRPSAAS
ncbi:hypothetical protein PLESTB_000820000 [Pleodorina starrii]|uniref:Aminotransferase class I/classII large domain-containing protein n=1 Tax=Pleodorina starrii TaxID=330485 RepID=A0A9W6BLF5_9CHLO|nr:hypothetical protein PLESTM_000135500 [Pleodorina starrii]GLC54068.1 hypothetical protein PLESTB_000820000 [Pleodorina starrii]GLC64626.1 hypothetical protein PLESTF_000186300 [Pleodorina starrii]